MAPRLSVVIALASLIGAGIVSANVSAQAEPAQQTDNSGKHHHHHFMPSPADRAAFLDARVAAMHAGLALTPDQDKLWPPVEQAYRDFAKLVASERQAFHEQGKTLDPVAKLQMRSDNMIARGQALKKLAAAAGPLYAALTEEQKHRLPILLHAIRPHHHRHHHRWMMHRWHHEHMHGMHHHHDGGQSDDSGSDESK
ncbi:MAG TPA: Spy/CpxP family protein refolding chaperone [Methylovirgula sp.]|nr:Spy/CpxP family protein refolding chaperone [Methylovirgula sp.]